MTRKMASLRTINEIRPHTNADSLELAIIDGWQCIVRKGEFLPGEQVVYLEIDSWVPQEVAPFLTKGAKVPREFEGVKGERLRTVRLRGEVSQGLVLKASVIPADKWDEINADTYLATADGVEVFSVIEGIDVSEILNVKKYERPVAANMRGQARGNFPVFIRKTDQERIQNRLRTLERRDPDEVYEATLKLDGSSTSFYVHVNDEGFIDTGVCSRNLELKTDESNAENLFVQMYHKLNIHDRLLDFYGAYKGRSIAIQGELYGLGINGNWEGLQDVRFAVFDIFDCDKYSYVNATERFEIVRELMLPHTPVIGYGTLADFGLGSLNIEDFLKFADRPSLHNAVAEGVVFKSLSDPNFTFKVINNKYLLCGGD